MAAHEGTNEEARPQFVPTYTHTVAGYEREVDVVLLDHTYSKPWHCHSDHLLVRPTRTLFVTKLPRTNNNYLSSIEELVDVETEAAPCTSQYDMTKSRQSMSECERQVNGVDDVELDDWEDRIQKTGWTKTQSKLFSKVVQILHSDRLARLALSGHPLEPIQRRINVDATARKIRKALAGVAWETKLVQWLHQILVDKLTKSYLAQYLDALQTLKWKIPTLVEKMVSAPGVRNDATKLLMQRPWDPSVASLTQHKLKRLSGFPLLVLVPSVLTPAQAQYSRRMRFWNAQLSALGKVIPIHVQGGGNIRASQWVESVMETTKHKLNELKSMSANRPIILVGWNTSTLVMCQVALSQSSLCAVVCLGFPSSSVDGRRGEADDVLLDLKVPILFIVGQNSSASSIDDVEGMRTKMKTESGLVVVGGADDWLRVSKAKKLQESVTQSMVDRCILDEISMFLTGVLSPPPPPPPPPPVVTQQQDEKKRKASSSSTASSEPMSPPAAKLSRPSTPVETSTDLLFSGVTPSTTVSYSRGRGEGRGARGRRYTRTPTSYIGDKPTTFSTTIGSFSSLSHLGQLKFSPLAADSRTTITGKEYAPMITSGRGRGRGRRAYRSTSFIPKTSASTEVKLLTPESQLQSAVDSIISPSTDTDILPETFEPTVSVSRSDVKVFGEDSGLQTVTARDLGLVQIPKPATSPITILPIRQSTGFGRGTVTQAATPPRSFKISLAQMKGINVQGRLVNSRSLRLSEGYNVVVLPQDKDTSSQTVDGTLPVSRTYVHTTPNLITHTSSLGTIGQPRVSTTPRRGRGSRYMTKHFGEKRPTMQKPKPEKTTIPQVKTLNIEDVLGLKLENVAGGAFRVQNKPESVPVVASSGTTLMHVGQPVTLLSQAVTPVTTEAGGQNLLRTYLTTKPAT